MKLIDEKGRIFGLINYIDLIIVLVVLVVVGNFLLLKDTDQPNGIVPTDNKAEITVTFYISGIKDVSVNGVKEGDIFRSVETKGIIGEVIKKEVKPSKIMTTDINGNVIYSEIPDKYDLYITIKGTGTVSDKEIKIGNETIQIGKSMLIESRMNRFMSIVYEIEQ
jgi:hypothetical protein